MHGRFLFFSLSFLLLFFSFFFFLLLLLFVFVLNFVFLFVCLFCYYCCFVILCLSFFFKTRHSCSYTPSFGDLSLFLDVDVVITRDIPRVIMQRITF